MRNIPLFIQKLLLNINTRQMTDVTVDCFIVKFPDSKDLSLRETECLQMSGAASVYSCFTADNGPDFECSPRGNTTHKGKYYKHSGR